jgi:PHD/YefM family antitoxin component YafN of YafNO toxin-antitoxin module
MKVTAKELIRHFGKLSDEAFKAPLFITKNGRPRLVLLSSELFNQLKAQCKLEKQPGKG